MESWIFSKHIVADQTEAWEMMTLCWCVTELKGYLW